METIRFETDTSRYRHWKLDVRGEIATLAMSVAEDGGLAPGYSLKLNSYDLGVVIDKRRVRRDHADFFSTTAEGVRGKRAVEWRLVDELVPRSRFDARVAERAGELAAASDRPKDAKGIELAPLERRDSGDGIEYGHVSL